MSATLIPWLSSFFGFTAVVVTTAQHPHLLFSKVHIISADSELILHTDVKDT